VDLQDYLFIKNIESKDKIVDDYLQRMEKCIPNILKLSNIKSEHDGQVYLQKNLKEFLTIFQVLIGSIAKERLKRYENKEFIRSIADKIFTKLLKIRKMKDYMYKFPSLIFTEFCKGITYFENDYISELDKLVYHRDASCGASDRDYLNKFQKNSNDTEEEGIYKMNALKKCYIERSIFNSIYMLFKYQDVGHLLELKHIERLLEEYYPKHNLAITITEYDNIYYPKTLTIINSSVIHDMNIQIIENYTKVKDAVSKDYVDNVSCYKTIIKQKNGKSIVKAYNKTQTFQKEFEWNRVHIEI
jgi:hypothetical protein